MGKYDAYKPYRVVPGAETRQYMVDEVPTDQHEAYLASTENRIDWSVDAAARQLESQGVMPEDFEGCIAYPAVNPKGCYTKEQMGFADRLQTAALRSKLLPAESQSVVSRLITLVHESKTMGTVVGVLRHEMEASMQEIRLQSRVAKICDDADIQEIAEMHIEEELGKPSIQNYENFVQGIEYLSGIRQGTPSPEVQALFDRIHPNLLTEASLNAAQNATPNPELLNIQYPDVQHVIDNSIAAAPQNWNCHSGDTHTPLSQRNLQPGNDMDELVSNFAVGSTKRHLGVLFGPIENNEPPKLEAVSRASLITIGGKSVRELIVEEAQRQGKTSQADIQNFFEAHAEALSAEYVAAGVLSGKRVETFIPDKDGKLPTKPHVITQQGVKQEELPPATMNGFQRFFNKFGFFKEAASKVEEYNAVMKSRQTVQENYKADCMPDPKSTPQALRQNMFGDVSKTSEAFTTDNFPGRDGLSSPYRTSRTAAQNLAVGTLLAQGHSMEDILDPTKLRAEKDSFAQEYVAHAEQCDARWLYEKEMEGIAAFSDYMTKNLAQIDLADKTAVDQLTPALRHSANALHDLFQEKNVLAESYGADIAQWRQEPVAGTGMTRDAYYEQKILAGEYSALFIEGQERGMKAERNLREGVPTMNSEFNNAIGQVTGAASQRAICAAHAAEFGKEAMFTQADGGSVSIAGAYRTLDPDFGAALAKPPKAGAPQMTAQDRKEAGRAFADGALDHCFTSNKVRCGGQDVPVIGVAMGANFAAESQKAVQQARERRMENPTITAPTAARTNTPAPTPTAPTPPQNQGRTK